MLIMPVPQQAAQLSPGILSIDSIHAVGTNPKVDNVLPYDAQSDQWIYDPVTNPTWRIEVHFTFTNTGQDITSGSVSGYIDQSGLSAFPVGALPHGGILPDEVVWFQPQLVYSSHVITLSFREYKLSPLGYKQWYVIAHDSVTLSVVHHIH